MIDTLIMIDILKGILLEGIELSNIKVDKSKTTFSLSFRDMKQDNCEISNACPPGGETEYCCKTINRIISAMYDNVGNIEEAKAWSQGVRLNLIDLRKYKADEIEYQQISSIGKAYLDVAKKSNDPSIECMGWSHPLFIPIITNMAFACELFLKSLLKRDGKQARGHKLIELFEALKDELKDDIIGSEEPEEFKCNLSKISNLFVDWRYVYEQPLDDIEFSILSTFAERLQAVIENSEDNI